MPDHLINKTQFTFFKKLLSNPLYNGIGSVKANASCKWATHEHRIGKIVGNDWVYTQRDKDDLIQLVNDQRKVDLISQSYPEQQSRLVSSLTQSNEKLNAFSVNKDFVLINVINALTINDHVLDISLIDSLGLFVQADKIVSVEHQQIVLVENLTVMAHLDKLVFTETTQHLKNALWVYRGDIKTQQSTCKAYQFFRRFKDSHDLICFADIDPAGFEIVLTSGAEKMLAVSTVDLINFEVNDADNDYFNQRSANNYLSKQGDLSLSLTQLINVMVVERKTIKQEHILSHQIPVLMLGLYNTNHTN